MVHYVATGIFIAKCYFKCAKRGTDIEEKAQITVIKNQIVHWFLTTMSINPPESFQHILWQFCNRMELFYSCDNETEEETSKLKFKNYTPKN